jgi:hypothetical protein
MQLFLCPKGDLLIQVWLYIIGMTILKNEKIYIMIRKN